MTKACPNCGETESDFETCACCNIELCDDCIIWCCDEDDENCGDYFCENCAPPEEGEE